MIFYRLKASYRLQANFVIINYECDVIKGDDVIEIIFADVNKYGKVTYQTIGASV